MLNRLSLEPVHRQGLLRRGLSESEIERRGYRSLPQDRREELAEELAKTFGDELCERVPGLYAKDDGTGWSLAGASRLLVPVRDVDGRVVALKVRRSDPSDGGSKYMYLSSTRRGGPGPGSPVHLPLTGGRSSPVIRVIEGELKADVATALDGTPTVSIPGVASWRSVLPVLDELGPDEVRLAFDADACENVTVARSLSQAFRAIEAKGFEVKLETWEAENGKGIDDLLAAEGSPEVSSGAAARQWLDTTLAKATGVSLRVDQVVTAQDLLAREFPEPRWIVPGVLPEGATILAGKPKTGKSWLALEVALAVASSGMVLGDVRVEWGEVLYLALEDNQRRLQRRLKKLILGGVAPADLGVATHWPRLNQGGLEGLRYWLESHPKARLIVIDTLAKLRRRGSGKNVYAEDYEAVEPLLELASGYNAAILIVHHLRKMGAENPLDQVSDSMGLTGGVDGALILKKERGRADGYLYVTGRDIEEERELALT